MPVNNNDDPNFERRLIIAFALSVLLFLVVLPYLSKRSTPPAAPAHAPATASTPAAPNAAAPVAPPTASPSTAPSTAPFTASSTTGPSTPATPTAQSKPEPTIVAAAEQQIAITTPVYHLILSNRGAAAREWILTQYKDDNGKPLNVVAPDFAAKFGYPLEFWVADTALRQQLDQALYRVDQTTTPDGAQTVTFTWSQGGIYATKKISFGPGYVTQIHSSVVRDGKPVPAALAWQGAFGDRAVPGDFSTEEFLQQTNSSVSTTAVKKVVNDAEHEGQYNFAGVEDQFFAAVFLPQGDAPLDITTFKNSYEPRLTDASGNVITNKPVDTVGLAVSNGATNQTRLFVGPKKIDLLKSIDPALRGLVDFGWFSFVAEPLFLWMNWTYVHWIHNYGWVILFLTFVLTMASFPLKMKAQKSQSKMMALQPKVNALNAKAKKYPMRDPRRQEAQAEVMKLYSEYGVNPLGGCLPMLITLPLIYAFWRVLEYAIELRHAPWIGYIHDLSAKDPYFILPALVVLTQFFTMQLMPTTPGQDPRQAKMMKWMMPIVMGWFFFYLPAGVNLYYLGYNVISVGQQWVANRTYNDAAVAAIAATDAAKGKKGRTIEGKVVTGKQR